MDIVDIARLLQVLDLSQFAALIQLLLLIYSSREPFAFRHILLVDNYVRNAR